MQAQGTFGPVGLRIPRNLAEQIFAVAPLALLLADAPTVPPPLPPPPLVGLSARETIDGWDAAGGGGARGAVLINRLQLSATFAGDAIGLAGLRVHAQVLRVAGPSLSARVGDIQTVDSIEALGTTRLFEAWVEQAIGKPDAGGGSIRAGLIDLNSEFTAIDPAGLFVNSSQGIAADLARSGRNGPSIYPVTSLAIRGEWTPSPQLAVRAGIFDGVPGDPDRPREFVVVKLHPSDGILAIGQVDYKPAKDVKLALGAWHYTADFDAVDGTAAPKHGDSGVYGFASAPIPGLKDWSAWVRAGIADPEAQDVSGYLGGGVVVKGAIPGRKDDRVGLAIAHAILGPAARSRFGLPSAETSIEGTYQVKVNEVVALQPDLQYVLHPASGPGIGNALVVGLRVILTGVYPRPPAPVDPVVDPSAPPDASDPPPPDPPSGG